MTKLLWIILPIIISGCAAFPQIADDAKDIAEDYSGLEVKLDKDCFDRNHNIFVEVRIEKEKEVK